MKTEKDQAITMAREPRNCTANVVPFRSGDCQNEPAHGSVEEQLEETFVLQRKAMRSLEYTLALMAQSDGGAAYRAAYRLIAGTLADLRAIAPEAISGARDLTGLNNRLRDCDYVLNLCHQLICDNPPSRP